MSSGTFYSRPKNWCVIPARLQSTRLPNKLLRSDHGEPLICTTVRRALASNVFDAVLVLTDSESIVRAVSRVEVRQENPHRDAYATSILQHAEFRNGTERVASLVSGSAGREPDVIVGLQADEPEICDDDFRNLIAATMRHPSVDCATLVGMLNPDNAVRQNVVKASTDEEMIVGDFAREPALCRRGWWLFHHLGIYAWKPSALRWYRSMPPSRNETTRNLEQMRVLENGGRIRAVMARCPPNPGIDDEESYQAFVQRAKETING